MSNGGSRPDAHEPPCSYLSDVSRRQDAQDNRLAQHTARLDLRVGEMLRACGEAAEHSKNAARDARLARVAAEQVATRTYAPVNEVIARHTSGSPPPDYDDDLQENTGVQHVSTIIRRAKHAERQRVLLAIIGAVVTIATAITTYLTTRGHP